MEVRRFCRVQKQPEPPFVRTPGDNGPAAAAGGGGGEVKGWSKEGGRRNLNLTQEALRATQNKVLSSGISPPPASRKTISPVIKGELNRLISSKVTEGPPPPPPSSSTMLLSLGGGRQ